MAARVQQLLSNEALRSRFSANAARSARQRFDLGHQSDTYLAWYNEIVQSWQTKHPA
jgi:glycosyltransferase involved in cell wall biosynthesis